MQLTPVATLYRQPLGTTAAKENPAGHWVERVVYINLSRVISITEHDVGGKWLLELDSGKNYIIGGDGAGPNLAPAGTPLVLFKGLEAPAVSGLNIEAKRMRWEANGLGGRDVFMKWQLSINGILLSTGHEYRFPTDELKYGLRSQESTNDDPILRTAERLAKVFNTNVTVIIE